MFVGRVPPDWNLGMETDTGPGIKEPTRLVWHEASKQAGKYGLLSTSTFLIRTWGNTSLISGLCVLVWIYHYYKMWVQFISPCSLDQWIHCFFISLHSLQPVNSLKIQWNHLIWIYHYYKMWVQFISPCSLDQWIHCFFISLHSLQQVNSLTIQWNHLTYRNTFLL